MPLLAGLMLFGCASIPESSSDIRLTDPDTLATTRSFEPQSSRDVALPDSDWWTAFGDPQLDALIAEALQDNASLAMADARLHQAQAQAGLVDAARQPTLAGSAQYTGVQIPENFVKPPLGGQLQTSTVLMLDFRYAPDLWGGKRAQYEAAVGQARAAEVDAQAARLILSSAVAQTYVALSQAFATREVAHEEQQSATDLSALSQQRVDAGLDNRLSLRQTESAIASALQHVQAAQQQIDALDNALAALLGKGPDRGREITPPRVSQQSASAIPKVLPSELLGHRADVLAARWRAEAARRSIDATRAAFKPSVNLNALVGLASSGLSDLFSSKALLGFGGPALSLPIFDGGRLRSNLIRSDADYELAVANYNQTLVDALHQVTDALQAAQSLDAQITTLSRARDAEQAALQLASVRYHAGLGTQLDVLSARRPLLELKQQLVVLQAQRLQATIALDRALGGGLVLDTANTPSTNLTSADLAGKPTP